MRAKTFNTAIEYIHFQSDKIVALQTTRQSPDKHYVSHAPFDAFNIATHVGDDRYQVAKNRNYLSQLISCESKIQWLDQVHGANVVKVDTVVEQPIVADAAITSRPNIALAVMTADCLPILLSDLSGKEIAAIHGGWRPLSNGIIDNTLTKMVSNACNVEAWLGPCIGPKAFEVGEEVKTAFTNIDQQLAQYFVQRTTNKWLADLPQIAGFLLNKAGVKTIHLSNQCTVELNNKFYSYRRDKVTGRMASIICIKKENNDLAIINGK